LVGDGPAHSQRAAVVGFLKVQIKRVAGPPASRERDLQRLHRAAGFGDGDELGEDLAAEDLLCGGVGGRKNRAAPGGFKVEGGAKLLEVHRLFSASVVASSSNFLTFPDGVIGSASMKCQ